jgi:hypothetical protein
VGRPRKDGGGGMICSIPSKLKETIKNRVEDALLSVDQRTKDLREEFNAKIEEMRVRLWAVTTSLIANPNSDLHEELNHMIVDVSQT